MKNIFVWFFVVCSILLYTAIYAQDTRSQLPKVLKKTFFEFNIGAINYQFSEEQFEKNNPESTFIAVPQTTFTAIKLVLFGYQFNKYLAGQITYMRPVNWVKYHYTEGTEFKKSSVWMNVGGLSLKPNLPIANKLSLFGEAGLAVVTRHGFTSTKGKDLVSSANYASYLLGGGIKYSLTNAWDLQLSHSYTPRTEKVNQPAINFTSIGFTYRLQEVSKENIEKHKRLKLLNPKHIFQLGVSSNIVGYGVNNFVSENKIPIFWGGSAAVKSGLSLNYNRNIFHSAKYFAFDVGMQLSAWKTKGDSTIKNGAGDDFVTAAIYPVFRLNFLHSKPLDAYFYYSVAGPSYISKVELDGFDTGRKFTFQDNMGIGAFFGEKRQYNAELKIGHYSNGNLFPSNDAVKIPLTLNIGYCLF